QRVGASDHVAEGAEILLPQHALDRREYAGNLPAAFQYFAIWQRVPRTPNSRERYFAALQAGNVLSIFFRRDQLVVTFADEVEQIAQKLANVRSADEIVQAQFVETATKVNPQVLFIQHAELFVITDQQLIAVSMKGCCLQFLCTTAKLLLHAFAY